MYILTTQSVITLELVRIQIYFTKIKICGCWFHYTQQIWAKAQKLGLSQGFRNGLQTTNDNTIFARRATFLQIPEVNDSEKLKEYFNRRWIGQVTPQELSIYELTIATNNAAESYSKLKSIVKTCHPRIWTFLEPISHIIEDTDNDIGRLREGREISRPRKKKDLKHEEDSMKCNRNSKMEYTIHYNF